MKPLLEETWSIVDLFVRDEDGHAVADVFAPQAGPLLAAAPDLYRALAAVEWVSDMGGVVTCSECESLRRMGHAPDCAIDAALKKARGET